MAKRININVTDALRRKFKAYCAKNGLEMSEVIRGFIANLVKK